MLVAGRAARQLALSARVALRSTKSARTILASSPSWRLAGQVRRALASSAPPPGEASVQGRSHEEQSEWVKKELQDEWVDWGMNPQNKSADRQEGHALFFTATILMIVPVWVWYYFPDYRLMDWSQREAMLLLRDREARGEEPISADLIPLERIELPTDEELEDTDIMI